MSSHDEARPAAEPHRDPTEWGRLVESLDIASIFVVIGSWLGAKLRAEAAVEDIWQETLWCSWRDRDQHEWRTLSHWRAWLLSIAKNRVRDAGRSAGRTKRGGDHHIAPFSTLAQRESLSSMLPPGSTTPSRVAGFRERALAMENALESLDAELRAIVHLRLFEEVPMREAAEQLGLPLSTAKERLLRGVTRYRHRLRQLLGSDDDGGVAP
ncbi:MAG: RNA polymerase sigma factor [Planctomycetes bacterium]|nr:RNA polymerase sigma factor [Planctomycetota bacterium]MCC7396720.1 RNA polymerase sigma factor [Planctomycetota bacterium]